MRAKTLRCIMGNDESDGGQDLDLFLSKKLCHTCSTPDSSLSVKDGLKHANSTILSTYESSAIERKVVFKCGHAAYITTTGNDTENIRMGRLRNSRLLI